jgi:hypothetical protein
MLCRFSTAFVLTFVALSSVAVADPEAAQSGLRHNVLFDPTPPQIGSGGLHDVLPFPKPPLNVISPLQFNFTTVGNLAAMQAGSPAQQALAAQVINGFVTAGDVWRTYFADAITVNIEINFAPLGNGVLGGNLSEYVVPSYSQTKDALALDTTSADDALAVANLQPGASLDFITNDTGFNNAPNFSPRFRDNNTSGVAANNNRFLGITRANAKALGFILPAGQDSNITFTDFSDFAVPFPVPPAIGWDFDPSNGIDANKIDFVGVAVHEICHAMGFDSGVDTVDFVGSPNGPARPVDLDEFAVFTTLDLYRYSTNSLAQATQPVGGLRDLAYRQFNVNDPSTRPFFSINGGATNLATFSTGGFNGDGRQASHWQDNLGIGIMDPSAGLGELGVVSLVDLRAMDAIGWNPQVPEPSSLVFVAGAIFGLSVYRPRGSIRRVA